MEIESRSNWISVDLKLVSNSGKPLSAWVSDRFKKFPSSSEQNFVVSDAEQAIAAVIAHYGDKAEYDLTDGVSLSFDDWRFNLRKSNTEPLIRLNLEGRGSRVPLDHKLLEIKKILLCY